MDASNLEMLVPVARRELAQLVLDFAEDFDAARLPPGFELDGQPWNGGHGYSGAIVRPLSSAGRRSGAILINHFTNPLEFRTLLGTGDIAAANRYRLGRTDIEQSDLAFQYYQAHASRLRKAGIRLDLAGYSLGGTEAIDVAGRAQLDPSIPAACKPAAYVIAAPDASRTLQSRGLDTGLLDSLVLNEVIENDSICGKNGSYRLNQIGRNVLLPPAELSPGWTDNLGMMLGYDVDSLYDAMKTHVPEVYKLVFGLS